MLDTSYKHSDLNFKLYNLKKIWMTLIKFWVSENCKNGLKNFFSVNFTRFGFQKTLKNTCQMKDKIKCNKTLYIFLSKLWDLNFLTQFQIYEIIIYVILFVLFLALNKNKPHYNMLNSLGAMIFCFIKFLDIYLGKWLKSRKKKIRGYFRQMLTQYFFIKNIVFYCL